MILGRNECSINEEFIDGLVFESLTLSDLNKTNVFNQTLALRVLFSTTIC
jgi:hypothetical protein